MTEYVTLVQNARLAGYNARLVTAEHEARRLLKHLRSMRKGANLMVWLSKDDAPMREALFQLQSSGHIWAKYKTTIARRIGYDGVSVVLRTQDVEDAMLLSVFRSAADDTHNDA